MVHNNKSNEVKLNKIVVCEKTRCCIHVKNQKSFMASCFHSKPHKWQYTCNETYDFCDLCKVVNMSNFKKKKVKCSNCGSVLLNHIKTLESSKQKKYVYKCTECKNVFAGKKTKLVKEKI